MVDWHAFGWKICRRFTLQIEQRKVHYMEKRKIYGYCRVGTKEQLCGMPDYNELMKQRQLDTAEPEKDESLDNDQEESEVSIVPTM